MIVEPVREHRFVLVLRGEGLDDGLAQTDPEREGVRAAPGARHVRGAKRTADLANEFVGRRARC